MIIQKNVISEKVENINGKEYIYVSLPIKDHVCARYCGRIKRIKDYYNQKNQDLEANGNKAYKRARQRFYRKN